MTLVFPSGGLAVAAERAGLAVVSTLGGGGGGGLDCSMILGFVTFLTGGFASRGRMLTSFLLIWGTGLWIFAFFLLETAELFF
jgi:hypothetical protein